VTTLALDLGTSCGWALRDSDGNPHSGTWKLDSRMYTNRWAALLDHLNATHIAHTLKRIAFEDVHRHNGTRAAHVFGGFRAFLEWWADSKGVKLIPCEVGQIKKCATGNGRASKEQTVRAARRLFPDQNISNHNQADSLCLLYAHEEQTRWQMRTKSKR